MIEWIKGNFFETIQKLETYQRRKSHHISKITQKEVTWQKQKLPNAFYTCLKRDSGEKSPVWRRGWRWLQLFAPPPPPPPPPRQLLLLLVSQNSSEPKLPMPPTQLATTYASFLFLYAFSLLFLQSLQARVSMFKRNLSSCMWRIQHLGHQSQTFHGKCRVTHPNAAGKAI